MRRLIVPIEVFKMSIANVASRLAKFSAARVRAIVLLYFVLLALSAFWLYFAWDGTKLLQQAHVTAQNSSNYTETYFREVYKHYFPGKFRFGEFILGEFIGVSYYTGLFIWAPMALVAVAGMLSLAIASRWRWALFSLALIIAVRLLAYYPTLNQIATWTD
jgi:hypothetical protein